MVISNLKDNIAAIATPLGTGGVGVIRVSGEDPLDVVSKIFTSSLRRRSLPDFKHKRIHFGWVVKPNIDDIVPIDEVIVLYFKAPESYTSDDVVEIQCHGGINIVKNILRLCLESGARLAEKGEFTKRAFLNGKMDLSEAEAVLDLIQSKTDFFSAASFHNLTGKFSSYIKDLRCELLDLLSSITAAIDFPEDVEEPEYDLIEKRTNDLIEKIDSILSTAENSNLMRHGLKVAIIGKPNAGKSSLFNALLNIERSIVTDIPGTTRDIIQESIDIAGVPVTLIDTAGIRDLDSEEGSDYIESIGINITKSYIKEADLILLVQDLTQETLQDNAVICEEILNKPVINVGTKLDLVKEINFDIISVSSKTGEGLELIKKTVENFIIAGKASHDSEFVTNMRQQECLIDAKNSLLQALESIKHKEVQDFISIDLKAALLSMGEITGEVVSDEIINNVFSNFCIGK